MRHVSYKGYPEPLMFPAGSTEVRWRVYFIEEFFVGRFEIFNSPSSAGPAGFVFLALALVTEPSQSKTI